MVYSKLKRSKKKSPKPQGLRKGVVEGRGLSHGWRETLSVVVWEESSRAVREWRAARVLLFGASGVCVCVCAETGLVSSC